MGSKICLKQSPLIHCPVDLVCSKNRKYILFFNINTVNSHSYSSTDSISCYFGEMGMLIESMTTMLPIPSYVLC